MLARRSLPAALGLGFIAPALPAPAPQPRGYSARLPAGLEQNILSVPSEHTIVSNDSDHDVYVRPYDQPAIEPIVLRPGERMTFALGTGGRWRTTES